MPPDVAVIIVAYNSAAHLGECLQSVFAHTAGVALEVIVLDNASRDHSAELVRARFPAAKLLCPGRNLGFAAGVNAAARHATADYLLLLNPDTVLLEGAIDSIVRFARSAPRHGLYGARSFKPDGRVEPSSCWGLPTLWSLTMFATGISSVARRHPVFDPESLGKWPRDTVREVGIVSGCCLLVSRAVWEELGGFDERFFMYGEDADLALRARRSGYRPVICPSARLIHEVGQSSTPAGKLLLLFRGKATLLRTHWRGGRRLAGLGLLLAGVALRALCTQLAHLAGRQSGPTRWLIVWRERGEWIRGYGASELSLPASGTSVAPS